MKRPVFLIISAFLAVVSGCSRLELAGVSATWCQDAPEYYTSITVVGAVSLEYSSASPAVEITSDANVLPYVDVHLDGGTLVVGYKDGVRFSSSNFRTVVKIPENGALQNIRLKSGASCTSDCMMESDGTMRFDAEDGSKFSIGGISASRLVVNLEDGSTFRAGGVSAASASLNIFDGSFLAMDGTLSSAEAVMEAGSTLCPLTAACSLVIDSFNGNLSAGSSARFHSDGYVSGTLRNGSSIDFTGNAVCRLVKL